MFLKTAKTRAILSGCTHPRRVFQEISQNLLKEKELNGQKLNGPAHTERPKQAQGALTEETQIPTRSKSSPDPNECTFERYVLWYLTSGFLLPSVWGWETT